MSFDDFFDKLFGNNHGRNTRPPEVETDDSYFKKPRDPFWNSDRNENDFRDFTSIFDFKVMTDPFEMHHFFEQKFNEIMKNFMPFEGFSGIYGPGVFESPSLPAIEGKQNPRDYYLKPGLDKTQPNNKNHDSNPGEEFVGRKGSSLLDLFRPTPSPDNGSSQPRVFSSFRSVTRKTVTLPDGTVKTEEIIRNSDGTEEKRESFSSPDQNNSALGSPFIDINIEGLFDQPALPEAKKTVPRDQFLKPGYEKLSPFGEKVDKDLDSQILQSGIESLPSFSKEPEIISPNQNFSLKVFSRKTVTLPNGAVETEEIVRNSDGTEQRTITQTLPDGTSTTTTGPGSDPALGGFSAADSTRFPADDKAPAVSFALQGVKDLLSILFK